MTPGSKVNMAVLNPLDFSSLRVIKFGSIEFPSMTDLSYKSSRAVVSHAVPFQPADYIEDMGGHSKQLVLNAVFSNSIDPTAYPYKTNLIKSKFETADPDWLLLPDGDKLYARLAGLDQNIKFTLRDGVVLTLTFIETLTDTQSLSILNISSIPVIPINTLSQQQIQQIQPINDQITKFNQSGFGISGLLNQEASVKNTLESGIDGLNTLLSQIESLPDIVMTFATPVLDAISTALSQAYSQQNTSITSNIGQLIINKDTPISNILEQTGNTADQIFALNPSYIGFYIPSQSTVLYYIDPGA